MEDQQEQSSGDSALAVVVDIPSLAQALEQELAVWRQHHGGGSQSCTLSIGMVPELTRNVDEHEYNPQYVSIGPYHRNGTPNIDRDEIKVACLDTILSVARLGTTVEVYLRELARIEGDARSFYAHRFDNMTSLDFLRMLLLDACYVLNLSFGGDVVQRENGSPVANGLVQGRGHYDSSTAPGNKMEAVGVSVLRDVFYLAENQIPYLVVDKIHNLTFSGGRVPAVNAIAGYISHILQKQQYSMEKMVDVTPPAEPGNLLHLVHMHFPKPTNVSNPATSGKTVRRCRTAMEYYIHGVNFKSRLVGVGKKEAHCILDVMFDRGTGTLVLPRLNIDAETWRILRNLMALEQQNPAVGSHVTAYCVFMSQLACTAKDVELLFKRGVIVHLLGNNEEVAKLFSDLCKGVGFDADDGDRNYLRATCQALDELYHSRPRRWMALLVHKYSANPWLAVGLMAASLGLVCTMVQAVYAVLSYHQGAAK